MLRRRDMLSPDKSQRHSRQADAGGRKKCWRGRRKREKICIARVGVGGMLEEGVSGGLVIEMVVGFDEGGIGRY